MQQKMDYLGGVQDISFHVKQDAVSESGFSERLARCSPNSIEGAPFMEGV